MGCRRAYDTDLAEFVLNPSSSRWAAFRSHYAACPDCSAEVRAWTELHALLQGGGYPVLSGSESDLTHPTPERLLQFEQRPRSLPATERQSIGQHLAHCRSCTDEIGALRGFDFAASQQTAKLPRARRSVSLADLAAFVRRTVLHPGFAYAVVLLLLLPTVADRVRQGPSDGYEPAPSSSDAAQASRSEFDEHFDDRRRMEHAAAERRTSIVQEEGPSPAEQRLAAGPRAKTHRFEQEAIGKLESAPLDVRRQAPTSPTAASPRQRGYLSHTAPGATYRSRRAREEAAATTARAGAVAGDDAPPGPVVTVLDPMTTVLIDAPRPGTRAALRIPVPPAARKQAPLEVRVVDAGGRRDVRERFPAATARLQVDMHLPASWLAAGRYRIEVRAVASGTVLAAFALDVR